MAVLLRLLGKEALEFGPQFVPARKVFLAGQEARLLLLGRYVGIVLTLEGMNHGLDLFVTRDVLVDLFLHPCGCLAERVEGQLEICDLTNILEEGFSRPRVVGLRKVVRNVNGKPDRFVTVLRHP